MTECPNCHSDDVEEFFNGDCQCLDCKRCWNEDEDHYWNDEEEDNE